MFECEYEYECECEYGTDGFETIPSGLDEMEPGPELAGVLASIDVTTVSGYDRIVVLKAHQRMASHYQAQLYADMAAIVEAVQDVEECVDPLWAPEMAAAEIRTALRWTRRAADDELLTALDLGGCPRFRRPWRRGRLMGGVPRRSCGAPPISPPRPPKAWPIRFLSGLGS